MKRFSKNTRRPRATRPPGLPSGPQHTAAGTLEVNLTKCPRGTVFKIFVDKKKVTEVVGWSAFFPAMEAVAESHPGLYNEDAFFSDMESMI